MSVRPTRLENLRREARKLTRITILSGPDAAGLWTYRVGGQTYHAFPTLAVTNTPAWSDAYAEFRGRA